MRRVDPCCGFAVALVIWAQIGSAGQQGPATFTADASVVRVDVSVLGRDRRPVTGLAAADFVVSEDGKTQSVVAFVEVALPGPPPETTGWARDVPADVERNDKANDHRLIVLVLDDAMAPGDAMVASSTREIARKVIDQLGPADLAAVTFTGDGRRAQGFTQDRARLRAAVDAFPPGLHQLSNLFSPDKQVVNAEKARALSVTTTLRLLVEALATIPDRRKSIMLISAGAPVDVDSAAIADPSDPTPQAYAAMKDIVRLAQQSSVNIYSVDPGGLDGMRMLLQRQVPSSRFEVEQREYGERIEILARSFRDFNRVFADNTGGKAFFNTNEFDSGVAQILRETGSFYLLGYRPPNNKDDGRFRRIQVKVNRPGVTVNARRGYFAPEPPRQKVTPPPAPPALVSAIAGLLPKADLPLQATAAWFAAEGTREAAVMVTAGVRVPADVAAGTDRLRMAMSAFTLEGQARGAEQFEAEVPSGPARVGTEVGREITGKVKLAPGRYQLRISVESRIAGKSGSVYYDLDIPEIHAVSLSGIVLSALPEIPSAVSSGLPVALTPTTRRSFARTDKVKAFARIYQGGREALRGVDTTTQILDGAGSVVFDLPGRVISSEFGTARDADYTFEMPLSMLQAGPHLLRIRVAAGNANSQRDVPFIVR